MVYLPSLNKWCILHPLILFLPLFFYSLTIIACHESCKECTGTSPDNCLSCNKGYALIDSKCKGMSWHYHFICLIFKMIWCLLCIYCMVKRINGSVALCVYLFILSCIIVYKDVVHKTVVYRVSTTGNYLRYVYFECSRDLDFISIRLLALLTDIRILLEVFH